MIHGFIFILGLIGLWVGTKWVVKSAIGIANRFNLSHAFVGLAILSIGTDLPEVFISIDAAIMQLKGVESSGIITGNSIGSSISQISIVLGLSGLFLNLTTTKKELIRNSIALISSMLLLFAISFDGEISRIDGFILLTSYLIHYVVLWKTASKNSKKNMVIQHYKPIMLAVFLVFGFALLIISSHFVVTKAMYFADKWGVAQSFIGIVIIGLGTSLPELSVSIGAILRKSPGMSFGNIIGSNIFDILVPIGIAGSITKISMEDNLLNFDLPFLFVITLLVLLFLASKRGISRIEAVILIIIYLLYVLAKLFVFEGKL
jgi:cation:H+ antiporter